MTFELTPGGAGQCGVVGRSRSRLWYAVLDYGTNYCNLRNLMVGAGLAGRPGYSEQSSTDLCMQHDRIEEFGNCNKY